MGHWGCVGEVVGSPTLGLTGVHSGCVMILVMSLMIGEPPLLVSGLASNYFRICALLSTPDFGLRAGWELGKGKGVNSQLRISLSPYLPFRLSFHH